MAAAHASWVQRYIGMTPHKVSLLPSAADPLLNRGSPFIAPQLLCVLTRPNMVSCVAGRKRAWLEPPPSPSPMTTPYMDFKLCEKEDYV